MKFFFILLFLTLPFQIQAQQEIKSLPIQFNQYMRSYSLINPASSGSVSDIEINTGNQRHGQSWSNINTFYVNANFRLYNRIKFEKEKETDQYSYENEQDSQEDVDSDSPAPTRFHVAGMNVIGDKEGSFLRRTGVYGIYAWHTQLSENLFIAGGAAIGVKNYSIRDNYVYGGGSSFAPDGNVGVWVYDHHYHIGFSVNQVFNGKLKPLYETTRLLPHYNITAGRSFSINPYLDLKPSFLVRLAAAHHPDVDVCLGSMWQDLISATVNYRYKKGVTTMLGIERISIGNNSFKAMISYYIPFIKLNQINNYTYEITLNYYLNPRNKAHSVFL